MPIYVAFIRLPRNYSICKDKLDNEQKTKLEDKQIK